MSSITLTERNKLHKTTRYDHGLGIIRVNSSTKSIYQINVGIEDFTKTLNLKSRSKTLLKR